MLRLPRCMPRWPSIGAWHVHCWCCGQVVEAGLRAMIGARPCVWVVGVGWWMVPRRACCWWIRCIRMSVSWVSVGHGRMTVRRQSIGMVMRGRLRAEVQTLREVDGSAKFVKTHATNSNSASPSLQTKHASFVCGLSVPCIVFMERQDARPRDAHVRATCRLSAQGNQNAKVKFYYHIHT